MLSTNQQLIVRDILSTTAQHAAQNTPALIFGVTVRQQEIFIRTTPAEVRGLLVLLRNSDLFQMTVLADIQAMDRPSAEGRFVIKYALLSPKLNQRCVVELCVNETTPIPSVACPFFNNQRIFAGAG